MLPPVVVFPLPPAAVLVQFPALVVASRLPPGDGKECPSVTATSLTNHITTDYNTVWPNEWSQENFLSSKLSKGKTKRTQTNKFWCISSMNELNEWRNRESSIIFEYKNSGIENANNKRRVQLLFPINTNYTWTYILMWKHLNNLFFGGVSCKWKLFLLRGISGHGLKCTELKAQTNVQTLGIKRRSPVQLRTLQPLQVPDLWTQWKGLFLHYLNANGNERSPEGFDFELPISYLTSIKLHFAFPLTK